MTRNLARHINARRLALLACAAVWPLALGCENGDAKRLSLERPTRKISASFSVDDVPLSSAPLQGQGGVLTQVPMPRE